LVELVHFNVTIENLGSFRIKRKELPLLVKKYNKHLGILTKDTFNQMALKKEKVDSRFHYIDLNNYTSVRVTNKKGLIFSGYTEAEIFEILTTLKIGDVDTFNHKKTGSYILERIKNDGNTRNTTSIDS
jgi:hypothetical protein